MSYDLIECNREQMYQIPNYSTVCRFRPQNEEEPGMLFTHVLRLCALVIVFELRTLVTGGIEFARLYDDLLRAEMYAQPAFLAKL